MFDWHRYTNPTGPDLPLTQVTEQGVRFKTCSPVTFTYIRNTRKSPKSREFQQDIEPAGRYMLHNEDPQSIPGWESGEVTFECPLVMALNTNYPDEIYGPNSWKSALYEAFGAKGGALSRKLRALGYDGIVTTIGSDETREIVAL